MVFCVVVVQIKFICFGNDEWWSFRDGMHITVFTFFSWKWKFEKVRSCSFFRYMPPHKQYYVHAQHVLTFTYLDFSDGNVSCNLTETVNIFKYFTICIFFFIHTKKINRMMGFFPIFIKVFFFVIADVLQNCVEMWILKMQIFFLIQDLFL